MSNPSANSRLATHYSSGPSPGGENLLSFAGFVFDPGRQELSRDGIALPLSPKTLALLRYLLAQPGRVLGKDELIQALWGAVVVTDDSLVQCVKDLRVALGDKDQRLIKTLPRRGYMFDVAVAVSKREPAVAAPHAQTPRRIGRAWLWWALGGLLLAALLGAGAAWRRQGLQPQISIDEEIGNRRSVAVLAFIDKLGRSQGSTLGDDLADAVAAQLVRSGVRVIGRAATMRQDSAAPEFERIGREQGVRYVLGGRVTRGGGSIDVDAYLTEIATGAVYRLHEAEFGKEDEAVRSHYGHEVWTALRARYYEIETARARLPGREKDPVDQIALAWRELDRGNTKADVESARRRFEFAAKADPASNEAAYGLGWSHLAEFYSFYSEAPLRSLDFAEEALQRALELAPESPQNLAAWAEILSLRGKADEAAWVWQRALELGPENQNSHLRLANMLIRQGRFGEAQQHIGKVTDLRPYQMRRQQNLHQTLADAAFAQGRDEEAYSILKNWAAEFPGNGRPYLMLAAIDALQGRDVVAAANMAKHRQMLPLSSIAYVVLTYPSDAPTFVTQRDRLVDGLRKAGLPEVGK